jgi:hypothetical protein
MHDPEPLHDQPTCIKCGEKMWFSCTEIEKPGFVHHVYECRRCRSTQSFVTASIGSSDHRNTPGGDGGR